MVRFRLPWLLMGVLAMMALASCLPKAPPSADTMATAVAGAAFRLLTGTAAASSPTPTLTMTPSSTDTPTAEPTSTVPYRWPMTVTFASCGLGGPEPAYAHETSIKKGREVELLGFGSIDGYLVIRDPYFKRPCWIRATDIKIFPGTDWSTFSVMTPGVPPQGQ